MIILTHQTMLNRWSSKDSINNISSKYMASCNTKPRKLETSLRRTLTEITLL